MPITLVAAFDDRQSAQRAADSLTGHGFPADAVRLRSGHDAPPPPAAAATRADADADHDGFFTKIGDFFAGLFGDDESAGRYTDSVRRGGTVVVVDAADDDAALTARSLLNAAGAAAVEQRVPPARGAVGRDDPLADDRRTVMPVVQEELVVGKREVDLGGVRIVKRVTESSVSQSVQLRDERATIERRPVDRAATDADFAHFAAGTIELRETAEQAVVSKTARVVEEVVIGKRVTEHAETVRATVRRADVQVERMAAAAGSTTTGRP